MQKSAIAIVPFYLNKNNQEYLLDGKVIVNLDEVYNNLLFKNGNNVYLARKSKELNADSQYANSSDFVWGKVCGFTTTNEGLPALKVELYNNLFQIRLKKPVIKLNGKCITNGDQITITEVCRITIDDLEENNVFLYVV